MLFGIVYDIGDFPGDLMLAYRHKQIIIDHIVLFDEFSDFQSYYNRAKDIEDLSLLFTCQNSLADVKKAFANFDDICTERINFKKTVLNILNNQLSVEIYDAD